MKVSTTDGKAFTLMAECEADQQFVDALFVESCVTVGDRIPGPRHSNGTWQLAGHVLHVDRNHPQQLVVDAGRELLRSLGNLFRLGLREAADDGHVRALAANPQSQESLAARFVELQTMAQTLGLQVRQREVVGEKVVSSHGDPSSSGGASASASSVGQEGGAA